MLEIKDFTKKYKDFKAVDNISFKIDPGQIVGFIGHNGAGKTTTIKAIMGLIEIDNGSIVFDGMNVSKYPLDVKQQIAYIPDNPELYERLTGIRYLNFIADIYNIRGKARSEDIKKYGDILGMTKNLGDSISSYSHGMKQKLSIISAFIRHPKLLILDEPFVGLDPQASFDVKNMMKEMTEEGNSVFFSTHVLEVAEKICDRIIIVDHGKIIADGKTEQVTGDKSLEDVFLNLQGEK